MQMTDLSDEILAAQIINKWLPDHDERHLCGRDLHALRNLLADEIKQIRDSKLNWPTDEEFGYRYDDDKTAWAVYQWLKSYIERRGE